MTRATLAIIGGSLAGAKAAEGARAAGYDGRVVLIDGESAAPYERPPLTKAVLRGEAEPAAARVHPDGFYRDHDIDLIADRATTVDTVGRCVHLARGHTIAFDTAIFATGAEPRRLSVPGADLDGIHYLRTVDDALRLRAAIRSSSRVAVIGAGWIGSEVAASARQMGAAVVLIDPGRAPLHRVLGDDIGDVFRQLHAEHGVELRLGTGVDALRGNGSVDEIVLGDGRIEPADVVVAGIGVTPRTELAEAATGLRVADGIVVDQWLETNVRGIFAAGDVARAWHPRYRRHLRVEHWANALNQGTTAGRNAGGRDDVYDRIPYFFSDQYDVGLEYVGHNEPGDELTIRGDREERQFIAFWHRDDVVTAAMAVNVWDTIDELKSIVGSGEAVNVDGLADPAVPLHSIVAKDAA